jgi:hypothetical protein
VSDRLVSTTDSIALDTPTPETALGGGENLDNTPLESSLTPLEDSQTTNTPDPSAIAGGGDLATDTALLDSYSTAADLARGLRVNKSTIGRNITNKTKDEAIAWCNKNGYRPYYYDAGLKVFFKA